jgi:ribonucleotide reductase beta subunit family protein with ferritin-like domain
MGIFDRRIAFKPFEYPDAIKYMEAIQHSYWIHTEWNFASDVQDFKVNLTPIEQNAAKNAMLAISQIEVSVKRFWGKIGNMFPKSEFELVGAVFGESECFDDQTEILTDSGWKYFKDLQKTSLVAQYDQVTGYISFVLPEDYISRPYTGPMHYYHNSRTDLCVTPNHELLIMHPQHSTYTKKRSNQGKWGRNYRYPSAGLGQPSTKRQFGALDALLIAIQADGSLMGCTPSGEGRRDVVFSLKKQRKIDRLQNILLSLGIEYYSRARGQCSVISFKLPDVAPDVYTIKGFDYIQIPAIDADWGRAFLQELSFWDGVRDNTTIGYYNANYRAIEKIQIICTLSSYTCHVGINRTSKESIARPLPDGSAKKTAKDIYRLNIVDSNKKVYPHKQEIYYNGIVYCVSVPSGNIIVRRNKKITITGNCRHSLAYSNLLEIMGFNHEFDLVLENPVIQGRVDYLTKYLAYASDNNKEKYTLTLALFSLFIENISLFSQFAILKSFNKHKNVLKSVDNVIQATANEELIHGLFGTYLINEIRKEFPDWFDDEFYKKIHRAANKAYQAEEKILEWIFQSGELDFLSIESLKNLIKERFNDSIVQIGGEPIFETFSDPSLVWFNEEIYAKINTDFFYKRPVTYSKKVQSITADDLF